MWPKNQKRKERMVPAGVGGAAGLGSCRSYV